MSFFIYVYVYVHNVDVFLYISLDLFRIKLIVNKRGGAGGAPHSLVYQFYMNKSKNIYTKTHKNMKIHIKTNKNI